MKGRRRPYDGREHQRRPSGQGRARPQFDGLARSAVSVIDIALWDLKAKALSQPLYRLLGGSNNKVPTYGDQLVLEGSYSGTGAGGERVSGALRIDLRRISDSAMEGTPRSVTREYPIRYEKGGL